MDLTDEQIKKSLRIGGESVEELTNRIKQTENAPKGEQNYTWSEQIAPGH